MLRLRDDMPLYTPRHAAAIRRDTFLRSMPRVDMPPLMPLLLI